MSIMTDVEILKRENDVLRQENKDMRMRLVAVRTLVTHLQPACSKKLEELLRDCEGCNQCV